MGRIQAASDEAEEEDVTTTNQTQIDDLTM